MPRRRASTRSPAASEQIDRELAAAALRKRQAGQQPDRRELAALRRIEKAREETDRQHYYATCPKKDYLRMAGRPTGSLHRQADLYGIPIRGSPIDLAAVIRWLHDFLHERHHVLAAVDAADPMSGPPSPAFERWREEKYLLARLERQAREQSLLPRHEIHELLGRAAGLYRKLGERLQKRFGPDALEMLNETTDSFGQLVDRYFEETMNDER